MKTPICCVLGDSISEGIGSWKMNYIPALRSLSHDNIEIVNLAKTGTMINYIPSILSKIDETNPDIIIIFYGSVDAQIRANIWKNRFNLCSIIPKRYKMGGMLEPRAFYSKKWYRYIPDRLDNFVRALIKKYVLITQGKVQWLSLVEFENEYSNILEKLSSYTKNIILVSTIFIDDNYFLGSTNEYIKFNGIIKKLAQNNNYTYVDIYSAFENKVINYGWDYVFTYDHFHPNKNGYELIAEMLWKAINR